MSNWRREIEIAAEETRNRIAHELVNKLLKVNGVMVVPTEQAMKDIYSEISTSLKEYAESQAYSFQPHG
jgi:hypothetical protein